MKRKRRSAKEFKIYLSGFANFCTNYAENAKKVAPDSDFAKIINIYQKGLEGSIAGLKEVMTQHYESANPESRRQMDEFVRLSGVLPLLAEANRVIGKNSLAAEALASSSGIFEELKKIIKFIPGLLPLPIPFAGAIPGLLEFIDQLGEGIAKLLGLFKLGGAGDDSFTPDKPIEPAYCQYHTFPKPIPAGKRARIQIDGNENGSVEVFVTPVDAQPPPAGDANPRTALGGNGQTTVNGPGKLTVHLKTHTPAPEIRVSLEDIP